MKPEAFSPMDTLPAGVATATLMGVPLSTWVLWLNIIYVLIAIALKLWGHLSDKDK